MESTSSISLAERITYYLTTLLQGVGMTIGITVGAFLIAFVLGLALALFRLSKIPGARIVVTTYVEFFRGLPALTQLFILYFGLTYIGVRLDPVTTAIVGLGLIGAAYCCEIFRSGFSALHHGQREAAVSVGMTPLQAMRYVLFPQAMKVTLPSLASYLIGLIKETAVASAVAAPEILFRARNLTSETMDTPVIYMVVAALYFAMTFPIARWVDHLERKKRWS
ncbi:amino acid ABC transporter permease [Rhizobium leguminosarum]|uniref:amino acid ABC transporter permease n=1 Tax=Rhizobium leguminosarum TaxID=384 RepID=UPI00143F8F7D|nr:amino acid ABC transporter permease [Rhizobium leguminosarum]NKL21263.1 ABC transporter permease subunit [Rhizobium leguminosarum bv. viciae]NKL56770.1 ABC transporter permease subunit [Rhizobium leguminosarum bv. viciae]